MSYSIPVVPRARALEAFQIVEGQTTAAQIREFAGTAVNVGALSTDDRDLRFISVKTPRGLTDAGYGDWLVKDECDRIVDVLDGDSFALLLRPFGEAAIATFRARDANSSQVQQAQRIAEAFSQSLRADAPDF